MTVFKNKYRIESARLRTWDYASSGWYFVTICTRNRELLFGDVVENDMRLSSVGGIAHQFWAGIPIHSPRAALGEFVVMPNHLHGILIIEGNDNSRRETELKAVETRHPGTAHSLVPLASGRYEAKGAKGKGRCDASLPYSPSNQFGPLKRGSLQAVVNGYKAAVTRWCRKNGHANFAWQLHFYEHIIRNEQDLTRIRHYIRDNPARWVNDRNNVNDLWM